MLNQESTNKDDKVFITQRSRQAEKIIHISENKKYHATFSIPPPAQMSGGVSAYTVIYYYCCDGRSSGESAIPFGEINSHQLVPKGHNQIYYRHQSPFDT